MEEKDFQRIAQMVTQIIDTKFEQQSVSLDSKLDLLSDQFDAKLEKMSSGFDAKLDRHKEEILKEFQHQISLQTDDFNKGLAFIAEGHQMLDEKVDRIELRLESKIDSQARELDAHRCDPEAHRGIFSAVE